MGWTEVKEDRGAVFGTFGVSYETEEFERIRDDGVFIVDINPDCRVFIFGTEVTKDVIDVNINYKFGGNECSITLANPRGKYEITRQDLMGRWREDKDILSFYDYDTYKRLSTPVLDPLKSIGSAILPNKTVKKISGVYNGVNSLFKSKGNQANSASTRMIYETKFYSGIDKKMGDIVFDTKDPVYVFMKGRFSPYWYFAFSGIVVSWDDADDYGSSKTIQFKCRDPLYLWERDKTTRRGSILNAGQFETAVNDRDSMTKFLVNPIENSSGLYTAIRAYVYGYNDINNVKNCSLLSGFNNSIEDKLFDEEDAKLYRNILKDKWFFDSDYMYTDLLAGNSIMEPTSKKIGSPNDKNLYKLSRSLMFYPQLVNLTINNFTGDQIKNFYRYGSVRFWECDSYIDTSEDTGWGSSEHNAYGVCGTHPALSYEFINNFEILNPIWNSTIISIENEDLDKLLISPAEKIRESIIGSSTELKSENESSSGSHVNVFRPRLFLLLPKRFSDDQSHIDMKPLQTFELFKSDAVATVKIITEILEKIQYKMYSSQMGDIFIEPELYDFHPLEFWEKIEKRDIIKKQENVSYRGVTSESLNNDKISVSGTAYFFNPKANHPFFIMEKDRIRGTHTFNPQNIVTVTHVTGSPTETGGLTASLLISSGITSKTSLLGQNAGTIGSDLDDGYYVANGISPKIIAKVGKADEQLKSDLEKSQTDYIKLLKETMITNYGSKSLKSIITDISTKLQDSANQDLLGKTFSWNTALLQGISSLTDSGETESDVFETYILDYLCPGLSRDINKIKKVKLVSTTNKNNPNALPKKVTTTVGVAPLINKERKLSDLFGVPKDNKIVDTSKNKYSSLNSFYLFCEPGLLVDNVSSIVKLKKEIIKSEADLEKSILKIQTLGDYKKLEREGNYNPRLDMVKRYGWNPGPDYVNPMIRNGQEATHMAKVYFQKMYGQAFSINSAVIGRPEFQLNRPYYIEYKDSIGLLENFNLKFSIDSDYISNIVLTYIRKNALTYKYTLNELDNIPKGSKDNKYFLTMANKYYAGIVTANRLNNATQSISNYTSSLAADAIVGKKSNPPLSNRVAGTVGSTAVKSVFNSIKQNPEDFKGGLFSAHEIIGHIDFDYAYNTQVISSEEAAKVDQNNNSSNDFSTVVTNYDIVYDICKRIKENLKTIDDSKKEKSDLSPKIKQAETDMNSAKTDYQDASKEYLKERTVANYKKMIDARTKYNNLIDSYESLLAKQVQISTEVDNAYIALYGPLAIKNMAIDSSKYNLHTETRTIKEPADVNNLNQAKFFELAGGYSDQLSNSLYYRLFSYVVNPSDWIITKTPKNIALSGRNHEIPFYLKKVSNTSNQSGHSH